MGVRRMINYETIKSNVEELRSLAMKYEVPVVTATQKKSTNVRWSEVMEWSKEAIMMDMVSDIRCDIHGDIYGHEYLAEKLADHIKYLQRQIDELREELVRANLA